MRLRMCEPTGVHDAIVLIEPEALLSRAMTRLLAVMGHTVVTVEEAMASETGPRCLVVDEQSLDSVPATMRALPHVILTSEPLPARWHIKAILRKPFSAEDLKVAILQACLPPRLQHTDSSEWEISRGPSLPAA